MPNRRSVLMGGATLAGFAMMPSLAFAQKLEVYVTSDGVAINGYDPVAYFLEEDNIEGLAEFFYEWRGAKWLFSSAQNRDLFEASPEDYAPQYGGYCAFAMAFGSMATSDPAAWSVRNGKLYLNFSLSVRERWRQDPDKYIEMADANWPEVLE